MKIEIVNNPEIEIKLDNLPAGTVFEFESQRGNGQGIVALKLEGEKYIMLTWDGGDGWFSMGHKMHEVRKITKVWGKLVGLKVQ